MAVIERSNVIEEAHPHLFKFAGVPVDGATGTFFGQAGKGDLVEDTTNGDLYINAGTKAVPVYKLVTRAA